MHHAVLLIVLAALAAAVPALAQPEPVEDSLTVFFTGDDDGEVAPCGCQEEDLGGMSRKAAFFEALRAGGWDFLLVSGGDLGRFSGMDEEGRVRVSSLARITALMDYDAVALGDLDLAPGPEFVAELVAWLEQPILATNYVLPDTAACRRAVLAEVGERTVGVLAFLDPDLAEANVPWLTVEPWEASRAIVDSVRAAADAVVALAHLSDASRADELAALYPEIDLILIGHEGQMPGDLFRAGDVPVMGSPAQGRYLGRVVLEPAGEAGGFDVLDAGFLPVIESWGRLQDADLIMSGYYREMRKLKLAGK